MYKCFIVLVYVTFKHNENTGEEEGYPAHQSKGAPHVHLFLLPMLTENRNISITICCNGVGSWRVHSPAAFQHGVQRAEAEDARRSESGALHSHDAVGVVLDGAVGIQQSHRDDSVPHGVVLRALRQAQPDLGHVCLREVQINVAAGVPHSILNKQAMHALDVHGKCLHGERVEIPEEVGEVDERVVVHALHQLQPAHILGNARAHQNRVRREVGSAETKKNRSDS